MSEDPQVGLEDAAEFFRQGDEAAESRRQASLAAIEQLESENQPDPEIVVLQLERRARYTRWVAALMAALTLGCLVVFGEHWRQGKQNQHAGIELLDGTTSGGLASPAQQRAEQAHRPHSLRPADAVKGPPAPASANQPPQDAHARGNTPVDSPSEVPAGPSRGSSRRLTRQARASAPRAAAPASPRRAVSPKSRIAPRLRVPRAAFTAPQRPQAATSHRARMSAVVTSKAESLAPAPDYQPPPPTARFED